MRFVVFGLTISSSWGNGHATLWRGLCRALRVLGHEVVFFERDAPYYAAHRDETSFADCDLRLYASWAAVAAEARREAAKADVATVTSYCPDAVAASELVLGACRGVRLFYDLDTPVTLERLEAGEHVPYILPWGLGDFDLVLSFAGGSALDAVRTRLNARDVAPLYGNVDPAVHRPTAADDCFRSDLSYLGTYAADRRGAIEDLFVEPARRLPLRRFLLGGALYPDDFPWQPNLSFVDHVAPGRHPAFFSSATLSLNLTRRAMLKWGFCPSGRLFEAAACGTPQVTDDWEGLGAFFQPDAEILVARSSEDVVSAIGRSRADLERMARAARERVLAEHTAAVRARELLALLGGSRPKRSDSYGGSRSGSARAKEA
jgi:spore maturation protein CgeB